jgi:hypothetical protein
MSTYTEDHLVEQPAVQFIRNELGWDVVNCYDEWNGGVSALGRDGKREGTSNSQHRGEEKRKKRTNPALQRLNPDLPLEAIEGAVEESGERSCGRISVFSAFSPFGETSYFTETAFDFYRIRSFTNA